MVKQGEQANKANLMLNTLLILALLMYRHRLCAFFRNGLHLWGTKAIGY